MVLLRPYPPMRGLPVAMPMNWSTSCAATLRRNGKTLRRETAERSSAGRFCASLADAALYGSPTSVSSFPPDPASYTGTHVGDRLGEVGWLIVAAYLLALGYGGWSLVRHLSARERGDNAMVAFFSRSHILVIDVLFGIPDTNRYRFVADPLKMAPLALTRLIGRLQGFALQRPAAALPYSRG